STGRTGYFCQRKRTGALKKSRMFHQLDLVRQAAGLPLLPTKANERRCTSDASATRHNYQRDSRLKENAGAHKALEHSGSNLAPMLKARSVSLAQEGAVRRCANDLVTIKR